IDLAHSALTEKSHNFERNQVVYLHLPTLGYHWRRKTALRGITEKRDRNQTQTAFSHDSTCLVNRDPVEYPRTEPQHVQFPDTDNSAKSTYSQPGEGVQIRLLERQN